MAPERDNVRRTVSLLQYMRAYVGLRHPPVRDVGRYGEFLRWERDVPRGDGCHLYDPENESGAWLTVEKQKLTDPPAPPVVLRPWLRNEYDNPDVPPERCETAADTPDYVSQRLLDEAFTDDPDRVSAWTEWAEGRWRDWAILEGPRRRVHRLYAQLFELSHQVEREAEAIEMLWAHGLLSWQIGDEEVFHPLLVTRVELELDASAGMISVLPGIEPTVLDLTPLDGLPVDGIERLMKLAQDVRESPREPWDPEQMAPLYQQIANLLSDRGVVASKIPDRPPTEVPVIAHSPVLFTRRRRTGYAEDIRTLIEHYEESDAAPPPTISHIVGASAGTSAQSPASDQNADADANWDHFAEDLLLPLAVNAEQQDIAERLSRHSGVTVQGPPGTGKSHTIANLVAHLLAHGKRILVTSQTGRPLRVLRDMIPEDIRALCVSVLSADAATQQELQSSVSEIAERLGGYSIPSGARRVTQLREELEQCRSRIAQTRGELREVNSAESDLLTFRGREVLPWELARWVREHEDDRDWIPDDLNWDAAFPVPHSELRRLNELVEQLDAEDVLEAKRVIPVVDELPPGSELERRHTEMSSIQNSLLEAHSSMQAWVPPDALGQDDVDDLRRQAEHALAGLKALESGWLLKVRADAVAGGQRRETWMDLCRSTREDCALCMGLARAVAAHHIEWDRSSPLGELKRDLADLARHFRQGKGDSWYHLIGRGRLRRLLRRCTFDGARIVSLGEVQIVQKRVELEIARQRVATRWRNGTRGVEAPVPEDTDERLAHNLDDLARKLESALTWDEQFWVPLLRRLSMLDWPSDRESEYAPTVAGLAALLQDVGAACDRVRMRDAEAHWVSVSELVRTGPVPPVGSRLWSELAEALSGCDWRRWDRAREECQRLRSIQPAVEERDRLLDLLRAETPQFADRVESGALLSKMQSLDDVLLAWDWRRAESWLRKHMNRDPSRLQRSLDEARSRERSLIASLTAESTWLAQAQRVTSEQRAALIAWQQSVRRIGKGKGKYAPRWRAAAQKHMESCRSAVPVWILPLNRVVESFGPVGDPFDVVIVDESSQCDLLGLLAVFRARRAVIVGDDCQISPLAVGQRLEEVGRLIHQYLSEIPAAELYDGQQSLYDIATRAFPGVIMLREHFRCRPSIIEFSNRLMYGGAILPLREEHPNRLGEALKLCPVPDGHREPGKALNIPEADAVVDAVIQCCADDRYQWKTMGVITLLGGERERAQARYIMERLWERLGEKEMADRRLRCGDAYHFQGDERDVMFLSLVEAPEFAENEDAQESLWERTEGIVRARRRGAVLNKRPDLQRFNVAASRARDQMWVFHSVQPQDLHHEDVRRRLLDYLKDPLRYKQQLENLAVLCESQFEKDVLTQLVARDYRVTPQFPVGHLRIDLVVGDAAARLAVECDGDAYHGPERWEADLQRQAILERLGWTFVRIRGTQFYRDPDEALKPLWEQLDAAGIYPSV